MMLVISQHIPFSGIGQMDLVHSESESNLRGSVTSKGSVVSNLSNVLRLSILSMEPTSLKIASGQVSQNPGMFSR
jgi:hypothetical protein